MGMVRVSWLLGFCFCFNQISLGDTEAPLVCKTSIPRGALPHALTHQRQPDLCVLWPGSGSHPPAQGSPASPVAPFLGGAGCTAASVRRQHLARQRADKYRGEEEGSRGKQGTAIRGVGLGGDQYLPSGGVVDTPHPEPPEKKWVRSQGRVRT